VAKNFLHFMVDLFKTLRMFKAIAPLIKDELVVTTAGGAAAEWNGVRPSDGHIQVKILGLCSLSPWESLFLSRGVRSLYSTTTALCG
jgi:hypothetical protein